MVRPSHFSPFFLYENHFIFTSFPSVCTIKDVIRNYILAVFWKQFSCVLCPTLVIFVPYRKFEIHTDKQYSTLTSSDNYVNIYNSYR